MIYAKRSLLVALSAILIFLAAFAPAAAQTEKFAELDGQKIFYLDYGQGDEAVVFVHCWTCDHTFWRLQVPAVAEKYRVVLPDLPGHGRSDKPDVNYTQEYFVNSLKAVLDAAGVKKAVLVGHSMGASVVRVFALEYPDRVKALIIVDGALMDVPEEEAAREKWKTDAAGFVAKISGPDGPAARIQFIESMFTEATPDAAKKEILAITSATPQNVAESAMNGMMDPDLWSRQPVDVPVLAVYATNPEIGPEFRDYLNAVFPNLTYLEWEGLGHFYMFEVPDRLNAEILKFLEGLK